MSGDTSDSTQQEVVGREAAGVASPEGDAGASQPSSSVDPVPAESIEAEPAPASAPTPLFRFDPGWPFVIAGLALIVSAVLIPAQRELHELEQKRSIQQANEQRAQEELLAYQQFLADIERNDPRLLERLVRAQLNRMPKGERPLLLMGSADDTIPQWIEASVDVPEPRTTEYPDTLLSRIATGPRRLWVLATGAFLVFMGVMFAPTTMTSRRPARRPDGAPRQAPTAAPAMPTPDAAVSAEERGVDVDASAVPADVACERNGVALAVAAASFDDVEGDAPGAELAVGEVERPEVDVVEVEAIEVEDSEVEAVEVEAVELEAVEVEAVEVEAVEVEAVEVEAVEVEAVEVEAVEVEAVAVEAVEVEAVAVEAVAVEAVEVEAVAVEAVEVEAVEVEAVEVEDVEVEAVEVEAVEVEDADVVDAELEVVKAVEVDVVEPETLDSALGPVETFEAEDVHARQYAGARGVPPLDVHAEAAAQPDAQCPSESIPCASCGDEVLAPHVDAEGHADGPVGVCDEDDGVELARAETQALAGELEADADLAPEVQADAAQDDACAVQPTQSIADCEIETFPAADSRALDGMSLFSGIDDSRWIDTRSRR